MLLSIDTLAQVVETGKSVPGETTAPVSPDKRPLVTATPPHQITFMPAVKAVGKTALANSKVWGMTGSELCK